MKLQVKIIFTLLLVSLLTAGTMGAVAYSFLMYDFRQSVKNEAFTNFREDITDYLHLYGSLDAGETQESFDHFVQKRRTPKLPPPNDDKLRPGKPPFHFMVLDPEGRVLRNGGKNYPVGETVPADIFEQSKPIVVRGQLLLRVVQIGEPVLTEQDYNYLQVMKRALLTGIEVAGVMALVLGLFLGQRLIATLEDLTRAIRKIKLDGELQEEVKIRSNDEIGELARAFNVMNAELSRSHTELRELSIRDPLTGLFNRRHFDDQATNVYHQACRYHHSLSIMVGDLDHFKQINDRFSHAVGDSVLVKVAKILKSGVRRSDLLARFGGEEFVILFPETGLEETTLICEKLRVAIESHPWQEIEPGLKVTMSMGLSSDLLLGDFEKMLAEADEQLYKAKEEGRNRIMPLMVKKRNNRTIHISPDVS